MAHTKTCPACGAEVTAGARYGTASLHWVPTAADLGRYTVLVTLTDSGNGDPTRALGSDRGGTQFGISVWHRLSTLPRVLDCCEAPG